MKFNNAGSSRILAALALSITAACSALATPANAAHAEADPTPQQILRSCDSATWCKFHPQGSLVTFEGQEEYLGYHNNCSSTEGIKVITKTVTSTTTTRFNIEVGAEVGLGEAFKVSIKASYGKEWSTTDETKHEIRQSAAAGKRVDLWAMRHKTRVTGDWEMWHEKGFYGHNQWYVFDDVVEGQLKNADWSTRSRESNARC